MSLTFANIIAWLFVFSILVLTIYTMIVVKKEVSDFLKESKKIIFNQFHIFTPKWWTIKSEDEQKIIFQRLDTHYDWNLEISLIELIDAPENWIENHFEQENIVFDSDKRVTTKDLNSIKNKNLNLEFFIRIDGTATKNQEERLYCDIVLLKDKRTKQYLLLKNISSVLNGIIEGPFFEEMLKHLSFIGTNIKK